MKASFNLMKQLMLKLINHLVDTFGIKNLKKPSKKGSKGFLVFNPSPFQVDTLKEYAQAVGWDVINKTTSTPHPTKQGEVVEPHVYIGPCGASFDTNDDVLDYALSCVDDE